MNIFSTRPSTEELDYAQKELGYGFGRPAQLADGATPLVGNLLAGAIPTGTSERAVPSAVAPKTKTRSFKITD